MGNSKRGRNWVPILVLVLMVASISFVESSRKCLQVTTSENRETQGMQIKEADGAKDLSTVENSNRLVPSGANPLHHNNHPIKP